MVGIRVAALLVAAQIVGLWWMGQPWWCAAGDLGPVAWDVWSPHNSQHLLDAYSFTHLLHGVLFAAALRLVAGRRPVRWRGLVAVALEVGWEWIENTPLVIDRYRTATVSLAYHGDSIANSVADVGCCALGFALASRLPVWASVALFVGTELALAATIHDSLVLNVVMLVWPIEAVRRWQGG